MDREQEILFIYEDGVLKPQVPIDFPEGTRGARTSARRFRAPRNQTERRHPKPCAASANRAFSTPAAANSPAKRCMNAVDTNILIYSIDAGDDTKRRKALELIESLPESDTVIPWQAACEIAAVLRKMSACGRFRGNHADAAAAPRASFPIVLPQLSTLERSLHIQTRDRVSAWDSLLIAA